MWTAAMTFGGKVSKYHQAGNSEALQAWQSDRRIGAVRHGPTGSGSHSAAATPPASSSLEPATGSTGPIYDAPSMACRGRSGCAVRATAMDPHIMICAIDSPSRRRWVGTDRLKTPSDAYQCCRPISSRCMSAAPTGTSALIRSAWRWRWPAWSAAGRIGHDRARLFRTAAALLHLDAAAAKSVPMRLLRTATAFGSTCASCGSGLVDECRRLPVAAGQALLGGFHSET